MTGGGGDIDDDGGVDNSHDDAANSGLGAKILDIVWDRLGYGSIRKVSARHMGE